MKYLIRHQFRSFLFYPCSISSDLNNNLKSKQNKHCDFGFLIKYIIKTTSSQFYFQGITKYNNIIINDFKYHSCFIAIHIILFYN